jgi:hypothetical protein
VGEITRRVSIDDTIKEEGLATVPLAATGAA